MDYKPNGQAFTLIEQMPSSWFGTLNWDSSGIGRCTRRILNAGAERLFHV